MLAKSAITGRCDSDPGLYKDNNVPLPPAVDTVIKSCVRGYQNKVASYKANGTLSSKEGVDPLTYSAYR